jgi:hypothetical protein
MSLDIPATLSGQHHQSSKPLVASVGLAAMAIGMSFLAGLLVYAAFIYAGGLNHSQFEMVARAALLAAVLLGLGSQAHELVGKLGARMAVASAVVGIALGGAMDWAVLSDKIVADCLFIVWSLVLGALGLRLSNLRQERIHG